MSRFILLRAIRAAFTLLLVLTIAFVILRVSGDPARAILGPEAPADTVDAFNRRWGLDQPLPRQYGHWLAGLLSGDLGRSMRTAEPISGVVVSHALTTLCVTGPALILRFVLGIGCGILAALYRGAALDRVINAVSALSLGLPGYVLGPLLILAFAVQLRWLPAGGSQSAASALLPILTLTLSGVGYVARMTRTSVLEVMSQPYIRAASAKGLRRAQVIWRHALPNAAIPIVTIGGLMIASAVSGSIFVENVFSWPGIGRLFVVSVQARDLGVVQAVVFVTACAMVISNLVVDLLYGFIDPRLREVRR